MRPGSTSASATSRAAPPCRCLHGQRAGLFKVGRDVVVQGSYANGVFTAVPGTLVTKCPSKYTPKTTLTPMPELGRAALVVCFGLGALRGRRRLLGRAYRRRRLAHSAQNALVAAFVATLVASGVLLVALGAQRLQLLVRRPAHEP